VSVISSSTQTRERRRVPGLLFRLAWLNGGLIAFGVSLGLLVKARLGLDPWDVLNQGIARHLGIQIGWAVDIVGAVVLVAWIPLRRRPGIGTLINIVVVGLVANAALNILPDPQRLLLRVGMLVSAIVLNGFATSCYIGAGLGPGPRDGLMTGFADRGHSIRAVRLLIEMSVLGVGFALGGSVGVGTVVYALAIGPIVHVLLPRLTLTVPRQHALKIRGASCSH
jgi:uncharacterized membrane protein YczE